MKKWNFAAIVIFAVVLMLVPTIGQAKVLDAGYEHMLVVEEDGTGWSWGRGEAGELGNDHWYDAATVQQITTVSDFVSVSGGMFFSIGLDSDGDVHAWGKNYVGQLGLGTTSNLNYDKPQPVDMSGFTGNVIKVSAGVDFTLILTDTGNVYSWGNNIYGQLGRTLSSGTFTDDSGEITFPTGAAQIKDIVAGRSGHHGLALDDDGVVYAWGYNNLGQIGQGSLTQTQYDSPQEVAFTPSTTVITKIGTASWNSFGIDTNGDLWLWGTKEKGRGGDGAYSGEFTSPELIPTGTRNIELTNLVDVTGGTFHQLALRDDGTLWTFGYSSKGEMGEVVSASADPGMTCGTVPDDSCISEAQEIVAPEGCGSFVSISANGTNSMALCESGDVYAWGNNSERQLGPKALSSSTDPDLSAFPDTIHTGFVDYSNKPVLVDNFSTNALCGITMYSSATGVLPDSQNTDWELFDTAVGNPVIDNGYLKLDSYTYDPVTPYLMYKDFSVEMPDTFVAEARLKVTAGNRTVSHRDAARIGMTFDDELATVYLGTDRTLLLSGTGSSDYSRVLIDNTDFRVYRLEVDLTSPDANGHYPIALYIDGSSTPALEEYTHTTVRTDRFGFGDSTSGAEGISVWDYIQHNAGTKSVHCK